ncbi:30S ribosomal protein S6 [Candidatus Vidania fulgoroideorum]
MMYKYEVMLVCKNDFNKCEFLLDKIKKIFLKKNINIEFLNQGVIKLSKNIKKNKDAIFISLFFDKKYKNIEIIKKIINYNPLVIRYIILLKKKIILRKILM